MDVRDALKQFMVIHKEVESDCGCDPAKVTKDVQPLDGLGGFDSTLIPTVVRMVAKALGVAIPVGTRLLNPYISGDRTTKLALGGVATRFCELYGKEAKK